MKRAAMVIGLCLLFGWVVTAAPIIRIDNPEYNFGSILEGFAVKHTFVIQNTGDETLEIMDVFASCGCTATELSKTSLAPQETVNLEVLVNTAGFSGTISKHITVHTNDPASRSYVLRVYGVVVRAEPFLISASDAASEIFILIDTRSQQAYEEAHFYGSINLEIPQLADGLASLSKDTFIILYDTDGSTSDAGRSALLDEGYSFVNTLVGGIEEWLLIHGGKYVWVREDAVLPAAAEARSNLGTDMPDWQIPVDEFSFMFTMVVDIRSRAEFDQQHILGALHREPVELDALMAQLPRDVSVILYDNTGDIAVLAAQQLSADGYSRTKAIVGGLNEWQRQFGQWMLVSSPE